MVERGGIVGNCRLNRIDRRRLLGLGPAALVTIWGLSACGSSDDDDEGDGAAIHAPLPTIGGLLRNPDPAKFPELIERLEAVRPQVLTHRRHMRIDWQGRQGHRASVMPDACPHLASDAWRLACLTLSAGSAGLSQPGVEFYGYGPARWDSGPLPIWSVPRH